MNTLLFACVALLLTGQAHGSAECGIEKDKSNLNEDESNRSQIVCKRSKDAFLRNLPFNVDSTTVSIDLDKTQCFYLGCCNGWLGSRSLQNSISYEGQIDYRDFTKVGASLEGDFSCYGGLEIANTKARCDRYVADGSGWNLIDAKRAETLCLCPRGTKTVGEGATQCEPCPQGHYSDERGATECKPCPRGRYTKHEGSTQCLYCPAGHTTYGYEPNLCVGPELNMYSDGSGTKLDFTARVSYDTLGNLEGTGYWSSIGDWSLLNSAMSHFATSTQKSTSSYRRRPRTLLKKHVAAVQPIIENVHCYKTDARYQGYEDRTEHGNKCSPGGPPGSCTTANGKRVCYCRSGLASHGHWKPYCKTASGAEEDCDIPQCNDHGSKVGTPCGYERHDGISPASFGTTGIEIGTLSSAQTICDKLGGECTGVWGKGSSWRVTELSLSDLGSGDYQFYEKNADCPNPYYEYYFKQN